MVAGTWDVALCGLVEVHRSPRERRCVHLPKLMTHL